MTDSADPPASEVMWAGEFIVARREGRWEYVSRARGIGAAVILAIDDADDGRHVILVEQWRVALKAHCIELPAGLVGDDVAGEAPMLAAARELEEETGYRADEWRDLGQFFSSPGMVSESFTLLLARKLTRVGQGGGTENEAITVHRVALTEIPAFIAAQRAAGKAIDVKIAMLLAGDWLG